MTKFPVLGILVAMILLSSSPIRGQADTVASYGDTGSVGFTGKMPEKPTPPPEVTLPPAEKKEITPSPITVPNGGTQVVTLPATGDSSNKVYFVTALLFVAFIVLLFERIQKKASIINL
ncbi:LPXTG cell wall anchor domain-containing protein [Lactococcus lactis]|uniref:LPXTG cell wall anchor domain-containing protein n=1 Tax=Lactococcus lactis TaxID=1358 RepID=UPI0023A93118|nr:LPXTG cell wall anchor domain-containing protein [Lactococcus lactis]WEA54199.1 LPXTG cell wall anchor domain-containing protein [Lactococcus lactis]